MSTKFVRLNLTNVSAILDLVKFAFCASTRPNYQVKVKGPLLFWILFARNFLLLTMCQNDCIN